MIDPTTETLISFPKETVRLIPGNPSFQTAYRWVLTGIRGVKLETIVVGGKRFCSQESIARFIAAQNRDQQPTPTFTPAQRRVQAETASRLLQEAGI